MARRTGRTRGGIPKSISRAGGHLRGYSTLQLGSLKGNMRDAKAPFSDSGNKYLFNKALREVREEGVTIKYNARKACYYNPATLNSRWYEYLGIESETH
jgi:hypothetical protein